MKILGVSVVTILIVVAAAIIGRSWGNNIPLLNSVPSG